MIHFNKGATTICLIRHGVTDWNAEGRLQGKEDIELNPAGRQQAYDLAEYFQGFEWDLVISSPLKRAHETACIISSRLNLPEPVVIEGLHERDYGMASGLLPEERRKLYPDGKFPGQEEFEDLRMRAMNSLEEIVCMYPGKHIIVVSHGALINSVLYTISSAEFGSFKTRLKNGCINLIQHHSGEWNVIFYNKEISEIE